MHDIPMLSGDGVYNMVVEVIVTMMMMTMIVMTTTTVTVMMMLIQLVTLRALVLLPTVTKPGSTVDER